MSMQRKTITITDQMESWVKAQVDSGKYGNDSEYFRDLVRRDQERRKRLMLPATHYQLETAVIHQYGYLAKSAIFPGCLLAILPDLNHSAWRYPARSE